MATTPNPQDVGAMADWFDNRPINKKSRDLQAQALRDRLAFVGLDWAKQVKMLDYACGPGFLSRIYGPHVSSIAAIDISDTMLDRYRSNIGTYGISTGKVNALVGNLLVEPPEPASLSSPEYHEFDLITVGAALHHFPSVPSAVHALAARLRPGGVLLICDLFDSDSRKDADGGEGKVEAAKRPKGFTEEGLKEVMEKAGLTEYKMEVLPEKYEVELPSLEVLKIECFLAQAVKPRS